MTGHAVETNSLSKSYGEVVALNELSIQVEAGTIFGLLGPNGAGKTTTVRILSTVSPPTSGRAYVLGHDVAERAKHVRSLISVVPQGGCLSPTLDVYGNILSYLLMTGIGFRESAKRARLCLRESDLLQHRKKTPFQLSGGLRRKVQIARVLAAPSELLFVDEPTVGLDPVNRRHVWTQLADATQLGRTVFLCTQAMDEAEELCSNVALLREGALISVSTMSMLLRQRGEMRVELQLAKEDDGKRFSELLDHESDVISHEFHSPILSLTIRPQEALLAILLQRLIANGIEVVGVSIKPPTFEQVYLSLMDAEGESNASA